MSSSSSSRAPPALPCPLAVAAAPSPSALAALAPTAERARAYARAGRATNTRRIYASRWRGFVAWCGARGVSSLPAAPEIVALYITELADSGRAAATIELSLTAIAQAHALAGEASPRGDAAVQQVRAGIRRTIGTRAHGKAPLLAGAVRVALRALGEGALPLAAARDRALVLVAWFGALRRSELVALDVRHVRFVAEGLEVLLERSKTDQEGAGRTVPLPRGRDPETCPVRALRAWLTAATITEGAVFRSITRWGRLGPRLSGHAVAVVIKRAAEAAGVDPATIGAHSARIGLVTEAARQGRGEARIMRITGHTSVAMLRRYIRDAEQWRDVASEGLLDV
jgi:integrase